MSSALDELHQLCRARGWSVGLRTAISYRDKEPQSSLDSIEVYDRMHDEGGLVARLTILADLESTAEKLTEILVDQGLL